MPVQRHCALLAVPVGRRDRSPVAGPRQQSQKRQGRKQRRSAAHQSITPDQSGSEPFWGIVICLGFAAVECDPVKPRAARRSIRWNRISRLLAAQLGPSSPGPAVSSLLARSVRLHDPDPPPVGHAPGEGDPLTVRAPFRGRIPSAAEADPPLVRAVGIHDVELLRSAAVAFEHDLAAVGRKARIGVDRRAMSSAAAAARRSPTT